jgi:hypothetical protein
VTTTTAPAGVVDGASAGTDYSPAIYGSILVTTLVAVQWRQDAVPELIALSVVLSAAVFWLTHVWSEIANRRVHGGVTKGLALTLARHEATMLSAAIVPAIVLASRRITGMPVDTAVTIALAVCIAQLFVWGLAVGRSAQRTWFVAVGIAVVDCCLGLAIVGLKIVVLH